MPVRDATARAHVPSGDGRCGRPTPSTIQYLKRREAPVRADYDPERVHMRRRLGAIAWPSGPTRAVGRPDMIVQRLVAAIAAAALLAGSPVAAQEPTPKAKVDCAA